MSTSPDDRILPATRLVATLVIPFLVAAFVILYVFPTETERLFAWKPQPTVSAMTLAAAYASGIHFFAALLGLRRGHRVKVGLPSARSGREWKWLVVPGP
jgi:uncharacterized membrane protein YbhN (UPF0104 family)